MAKRTIVVNGYAYPNINPELLAETAPDLTFVSAFSYGVNAGGGLIPLDDEVIIRTAAPYGARALMVLSSLEGEGGMDSDLLGQILGTEESQERLIDEILANLRAKGMYGVDFDFEYIPAGDKDLYSSLIERARIRLNAEGYVVLAALAPKIATDQPGLLYEGHDYAAIGKAANLVMLMTYEWGFTYGPPMAVAPVNRVREVLDYGVTQIDPSRILMGIPNYGYDWTLPFVEGESRARSIGNEEAVWLANYRGAEILFDEVAQAPFFFYEDEDNREHEVWFEDARSIRAKLRLVEEYGLAGVSYWNLMRPFRANWEVLREMFNVAKL